MSHADTLRGMAKAFMMAGSHEWADTCLAGADSLETLDRVGDLAHAVDEQDKTIQALSRLLAGAEEAATERAVQIGRVRNALSSIARVRADSEAALDHGYDNPEWHEATADALEYVIDLLTEALEGDTP